MQKIRLFKDDRMWLQKHDDSLILCGYRESVHVLIDVPNLSITPIVCACPECLPWSMRKIVKRIAKPHEDFELVLDGEREEDDNIYSFWRESEGLFIRRFPWSDLYKFATARDLANFLSTHKIYGQGIGDMDKGKLRHRLFHSLM